MNRTPFSCRSRSGNHNTELGTSSSSSSNGRLMDKRTEKTTIDGKDNIDGMRILSNRTLHFSECNIYFLYYVYYVLFHMFTGP
jgi:hypothetical protein